jgi:hypothetical protein
VPHGADLDRRGRALERAHHGRHLGVGATRSSRQRAVSSRTKTSGPAAARGRFTERGDVRPSFASAAARARTCLAGAHEDLLEPVGGGAAATAEGP